MWLVVACQAQGKIECCDKCYFMHIWCVESEYLSIAVVGVRFPAGQE
jgi:hypothetical protein